MFKVSIIDFDGLEKMGEKSMVYRRHACDRFEKKNDKCGRHVQKSY